MRKLAGGIKIVFVKFSVIVPLYNKAPYVARTLQSVLGQTFNDYELIVVDDGSTDESCEVVEKMTIENPKMRVLLDSGRFRLLKQANSGVSTARNNGVKISQGDYLCFLDADDWWECGFLAAMDRLITEYPEAAVYGTAYYYYKNGFPRILDFGLPEGFKSGYIKYCRQYADSMQMPLWTGAVTVRRTVFIDLKGFPVNLTLGEDFYLWIQLALNYKVAFLNENLSYYFQDVPVENRAVGKLHNPRTHMLWNLSFLEGYENTNPDYKYLIDKLRVNGLFLYYLDKQYHKTAVQELKKVDWHKQPMSVKLQYKTPTSVLRMLHRLRVVASNVKQNIIKRLRGVTFLN